MHRRYILIGYLPSANPEHRTEPEVLVCNCDPSTQEVEAGGSESQAVCQRAAALQERP